MNIAPSPAVRPTAVAQPGAANSPPSLGNGQAAAAPRPGTKPELAVVAVLGYN